MPPAASYDPSYTFEEDNYADSIPASTLDSLIQKFPFPEIRPQQHTALQTLAQSFDNNIPFTLLDMPVGSGKSAGAVAAARHIGSAHYITSQNILTDQLLHDFGRSVGVVNVKGKANYPCFHYANCSLGTQHNGTTCDGCPYREAKNIYMASKIGTTNYSYILSEAMYGREIAPRKLLILDEAHNIENEIISLTDIEISDNTIKNLDISRLPYFDVSEEEKIRSWLSKTFMPQLKERLTKLTVMLENAKKKLGPALSNPELAEESHLRSLEGNVNLYLGTTSPEDWLAWSQDGKLLIRPLDCSRFANNLLFAGAKYILLMSATILDHSTFCRTLGIPRSKVNSLSLPSDFDPANRRIVFWPTGSMSYQNKMDTLPAMVRRINAILDKYSNVKGIVHTHTYQINDYLCERLIQGEHARRIITHTGVPGHREQALQQHCRSKEPTILFSPSMAEGVDLVDDLSRLQILVKVPYPLLDTYNKARLERDPKWYAMKTAVKLQQATGRSIRNHKDYALTVILDTDFWWFCQNNQNILSSWWTKSIEVKDKKALGGSC